MSPWIEEMITAQARKPEPLAAVTASGEGIDIYGNIKGHYNEDSLFKNVIANPDHYRNFKLHDGLLYI